VIEVYEGLNEIIRLLAVSVEILGYSDGSPNSCIPLSVTFSRSHATEPVPVVVDTENDHYQLLDVGWEGLQRVYSCFVHIDIKDGKVWIQRNMTEVDLGVALVELGVPKEDIILGLHPAYKRPYTGYGVA
jgi:XisI protein